MTHVWIVSDTHFGHEMLVSIGRPAEFEKKIIKNLTQQVKPGDTLIHLGDFCIGKDEMHHEWYMNLLPGVRHILVRGNHDGKSNKWYLERGWSFVCESFVDTYFGKRIYFSHVPILRSDIVYGAQEQIQANIHGHLHGNGHREGGGDERFHYDAAPELHDYMPVSLKNIVDRMAIANKKVCL